MSEIHHFYPKETIEEEARHWLIRLDGDTPLQEDEHKALQAWCQRSPAHRAELLRIAQFFEEANLLVELAVPLKSQASIQKGSRSLWQRLVRLPRAVSLAYAVALLVGLVVVLKLYQLDSITERNGVYATAIGEIQQQQLVDGSMVYLNTDSQVDIDYNAAIRKIRLLKGEAHFAVAKDKNWPFEVYVGEKMVKAVGTAFTIKIAGQGMSVAVTEGKVDLINMIDKAVTSNSMPAGESDKKSKTIGSLVQGEETVMPLQVVTDMAEINEKLAITRITEQQMERKTAWQSGYLLFAGDPLEEVIQEISRYTNTRIDITSPEIRSLRIGGRFKVDDLGALFNVLETSMGITVSRLDTDHITLSSPALESP